jgi:hypothetical protein
MIITATDNVLKVAHYLLESRLQAYMLVLLTGAHGVRTRRKQDENENEHFVVLPRQS